VPYENARADSGLTKLMKIKEKKFWINQKMMHGGYEDK
jgi:hypothetical protein